MRAVPFVSQLYDRQAAARCRARRAEANVRRTYMYTRERTELVGR